ncbi:MAG: putative Antiactivator of flagellar biosynthesis FleN [Herminiimonas sp.]|nr:putative Antiactivator of flagellar biosynthesis FleN [Herminiimonas sp.]
MANFASDQAEGLRRMVAGPKPRLCTFLSAASPEDRQAMLVNLAASLARAGSDVLLFDACAGGRGIAARLDGAQGAMHAASLLEAARGVRPLEQVTQPSGQGFGYAALTRGAAPGPADAERLANAFERLAGVADVLLADAELDEDGGLPLEAMGAGDIVIQVANDAESIKSAYALVKRLNARLGRRPFGVLVSGASEKDAQRVYANMAKAASRYLAVELHSVGSVPADEHVRRASRLDRPVVDAFPMAAASVAFRRLAEHFALPGGFPDLTDTRRTAVASGLRGSLSHV